MVNPNRSINHNHGYYTDGLRRGIGWRSFSVPPSFASLLLLSRAISASNPSRTKEVFSLTPVKYDALFSISSSMFNVVLICIDMPYLYINVNWGERIGGVLPIYTIYFTGTIFPGLPRPIHRPVPLEKKPHKRLGNDRSSPFRSLTIPARRGLRCKYRTSSKKYGSSSHIIDLKRFCLRLVEPTPRREIHVHDVYAAG